MFNRIAPILLNISLSIAVIIGLAMASKPLTGKSWQAWFDNEELTQAQQQINHLENRLSELDQNYSNLLALKAQSAAKADTSNKSQKLLWLVMKLQQKFITGESYLQEWQALLQLMPVSMLQESAITELTKQAATGLMTQEKLKQLLLTHHSAPQHTNTTTPPSNIWEYLKTLVTIERETSHFETEEILLALDRNQLSEYIAQHPASAWAAPHLEALKAGRIAVASFYNILDSLFAPQEKI